MEVPYCWYGNHIPQWVYVSDKEDAIDRDAATVVFNEGIEQDETKVIFCADHHEKCEWREEATASTAL